MNEIIIFLFFARERPSPYPGQMGLRLWPHPLASKTQTLKTPPGLRPIGRVLKAAKRFQVVSGDTFPPTRRGAFSYVHGGF